MKRRITMTLLGTATLVATVLPQAALARTELASRESSTVEVGRRLVLGTVQDGRGPFGGPDDIADCPEGHHLVPFDMPIYDEDGQFVVGYETVWFCIPDDLEPAG